MGEICAPKRAGEGDAVDGVDLHLVHEQPCARVERGFGQLDGADVALGHGDERPAIGGAVVEHIGMGAAFGDRPRRAGLLGRADEA